MCLFSWSNIAAFVLASLGCEIVLGHRYSWVSLSTVGCIRSLHYFTNLKNGLGRTCSPCEVWFDVVDLLADQHQPLIMISFLCLQCTLCFPLTLSSLIHRPSRCSRHSSPNLIPKAECYPVCPSAPSANTMLPLQNFLTGPKGASITYTQNLLEC